MGLFRWLLGLWRRPTHVARDVSTLPWKTLIREAPRFAATLHNEHPLVTSASFTCTAFCMDTFPNGGPEFLKCLQDCGD